MIPRWSMPYRHVARSRETIDPGMNDDPEDEEVFRGDLFEDPDDGWWPERAGERNIEGELEP